MDNNSLGDRIRKIREKRGYSQANVAEDLDITPGAYAKIERGETDAPASRLFQIANSLEVNIVEFFEDRTVVVNENRNLNYGYASKADLDNLTHQVQLLIKEVETLRRELPKPPAKKRSKHSQ